MLGRALRKGLTVPKLTPDSPFHLHTGRATAAGVRVSPESALAASSVYSATSLIAQTIASLPIRFVKRGDVERIPQKPEEARAIWDRPNPIQTTTGLIETAVLSQLLWGNAYIYPRRDRAGRAFQLWPIDPERVTEIEMIGSGEGVRFKVQDFEDVENVTGKPANLIHIPDMMAPGRLKGISRIEQLAELVGMSLSAQEHAAQFLGQGVHMSGTIEVPKPMKQSQAQELWETFSLRHAGPKNAGRVGILTDGATFKGTTIPPAELQFLEQMQYSDQKIASIYRVPPHMVGDITNSTSWGTGIEEQTIQFVQHTLLPIMRKFEEAVEATLLAGTDYQMRFVAAGLLRGNVAARTGMYTALWNIGVLSADDIRALEDMAPLPGGLGTTHYVPLNFAPVGTDPASIPSPAKLLMQLIGEGRGE